MGCSEIYITSQRQPGGYKNYYLKKYLNEKGNIMQKANRRTNFKSLLNKYLSIKGLDIVVFLENGKEIELYKNRKLVRNEIIYSDKSNKELRIPIAKIKSIDLYAA